MLRVDADGKVIQIQKKFGVVSERTRQCMQKIIQKKRFRRMKPESLPTVHSVEYRFV